MYAQACAARIRPWPARGDSPSFTSPRVRVRAIERLHVVEQRVGDVHAAHRALQRDDAVGIQRGRHLRQQVAPLATAQQLALVRASG